MDQRSWSMSRSVSRSGWSRGEVFSSSTHTRRSTRGDEDEEALRWAALEKLPTYNRLRTGIIKSFEEEAATHDNNFNKAVHKEVDVRKLDINERIQFIDRIFKVAEEDNEKFLRKLKDRIDKVGIQLPTVELRFEHLNVEADCYIGNRALPTLANSTRNLAESILGIVGISLAERTRLRILKDVSGIIKPSRMTLLLGPPSSGKTTLLLALAGRLDPTLKVDGEVTYNGYRLNEFVPQKTSAYISQNDVHIGTMTVKETLDFSARCQGVGTRYDLLAELAKREKDAGLMPDPEVDLFMKATAMEGVQSNLIVDYTLRILGLDICRDTIVGDEMIRGISGGQRKRVTTGEMIVGPTKTLFMDEISTGLDSSTTYQIVKCLQQIAHLSQATILMSLLQPAPETFELFDDVMLLSEGQIVYQGPREHVLQFFEGCGFRCPDRKGVADFLQEVTSKKDQEQYWADKNTPYNYIPVSEFAARFKRFHVGMMQEHELSVPFDKAQSHQAALVHDKYTVPYKQLIKASFDKEWLLIKRNPFVYIFKTFQIMIVAFITSTVFIRNRMHSRNEQDGAVYMGALMFTLILNMFNGFAEASMNIMRLPVFYKQRDLLFHPPWAFTLPTFLLGLPISAFESIVWTSMTYYSVGLAPEADRFFKNLLLVFLIQQMAATTWLIAKKVYQLSKASGYLFTALYLKQCSTSLMKYYAGESPDLLNNMPSVMVKLSNAGIPAIIPVHHRHIIMCRNDRSDFLVRYYLSLFSLCRIVKLAKPVSRSTFSTIVQGPLDIGKVREMLGRCKSEFPLLQKRYLPWVSTIPLHKGLRWMPTWKSVPNDDRMFRKVHSPMETTRRKGKDGKYQLVERPMVLHKNIFTSTKFEIAAFAQLLNLVHSFEGIWSPALLFRKATLFALDNTTTTQLCNEDLDHYERTLGPVFSQVGSAFDGHPLHMGRLVDSLEGAGKRRLFVIGNYVKQRLLYPVHQWAMKVLSSIPTDGTYHQLAPIDKLVSRSHHWVRSIDLSAATDRWPVSIIHDLMSCMFGPTFASSVVNGGLAMNVCTVQPPLVKKRQQLCFQTGQPLGYYGSWALFALSHHYIVWLSADKVLPGVLFTDYALLGDDIVICHPGVAAEYQRNLDNLGVSISVAKSIVSDKGFLEFAKKFICLDPYKDLSPVSAKAVLAAHTLIGVAALGHQYSVPFKALVRFAGGGFRVLSSLQSGKLSKRYRRLKAIGTMPSRHKKGSDEPLEYWIGRGFPLSPYLMGIIHQMVLDTFHPKKWQDVPMQQYWWEKERDNLEYTVLRNWVQCTLEYERWYYNLFLSPPCSLEYYLTPPVVSYTYRRTEYDMKVLFDSYGLTFQIYDLAEGKTPGWMPGVLGPGRDQSQTGFSIIMPSGIRKVYFHPGSNLLVDASRPKPN